MQTGPVYLEVEHSQTKALWIEVQIWHRPYWESSMTSLKRSTTCQVTCHSMSFQVSGRSTFHVALSLCTKFLQLPLRNGVLLSGVLNKDPPKAANGMGWKFKLGFTQKDPHDRLNTI